MKRYERKELEKKSHINISLCWVGLIEDLSATYGTRRNVQLVTLRNTDRGTLSVGSNVMQSNYLARQNRDEDEERDRAR